MDKKVISVIGPTAIGKTRLAIALAGYFNTDIISADSRQFYKEMNIGTAVPSPKELQAARHHFIQHKSVFDKYSVGDFERDALKKIAQIHETKDRVVMVGGSGLYIKAVTEGLDDFPEIDPKIRLDLNTSFKQKGITYLQRTLADCDPDYYKVVDKENPHRLIRALEVFKGSGRPYSAYLKKEKKSRPFRTVSIGIEAPREIIYERINKRVDDMMDKGLLNEAKSVYGHRALNALNTVGYKELFQYFDGKWTLEFAIEEIKKNTRRFAKRQLTWFRKNEDTLWVAYDEGVPQIITKIDERMIDKKQ